jgi:hypothetical protein
MRRTSLPGNEPLWEFSAGCSKLLALAHAAIAQQSLDACDELSSK